MRVLAVANMKGGVGKTSTVHNLASAFANKLPENLRVLVIDMDPQCNYSISMGVEYPDLSKDILDWDHPEEAPDLLELYSGSEDEPTTVGHLLYDQIRVMLGHDPIESLQDSIRQHTINYHYIPAHPMMGKFDTVFENLGRDENGVFTDAVIRNSVLWNILEQIKELPAPAGRRTPYDLVIIDTNPHLGNLTNNALMGCSDLLIPVSSELYPLFGVVQVHTQVGAIIRQGAQIRTKSILLTMTQNTNVSVGAEGEMKRKNGKAVLKTTIPRRVDVQEAALRRAPIVETHPNNPAALAYVEAAKELWGKIKRN